MADSKSKTGTTVANNIPVGAAGQPQGANGSGNLKKEVPEARKNAIQRRMDARRKAAKK